MSKLRDIVYSKYNGLCAYTGQPLGDNWQIDHIHPKCRGGSNNVSNLIPAIRIVNHYKRGQDLSTFRQYIITLHLRLRKLPKNSKCACTIKRGNYIKEVAFLFGIEVNKPWEGKFYFEII